jgi:hypothetical protein
MDEHSIGVGFSVSGLVSFEEGKESALARAVVVDFSSSSEMVPLSSTREESSNISLTCGKYV